MATNVPAGFYIISRNIDPKGQPMYGVLRYVPESSRSNEVTHPPLSVLLKLVAQGNVFHTATLSWSPGGRTPPVLTPGARVHAVPRHSPQFLSTDPNATESDNLSNLPPYKDVETFWAMM